MWTDELFHVKKPIIALLHLRALPGDPLYEKDATMGEVIEKAARELQALQEGGVDGILIANEFSLPYEKKVMYTPWNQSFPLAIWRPCLRWSTGGRRLLPPRCCWRRLPRWRS